MLHHRHFLANKGELSKILNYKYSLAEAPTQRSSLAKNVQTGLQGDLRKIRLK